MESRGLETTTVHQSLLRAPLFLGLDYKMLVIEAALGGAILFITGLTFTSLIPIVFGMTLVHLPARRLIASDPVMLHVVARALRYHPYYGAHSRISIRAPEPPPSVTTEPF